MELEIAKKRVIEYKNIGDELNMEWEEAKKKLFEEDPELKKEYDKLELEYKINGQLIDLRRKKNLTQKQLADLPKTNFSMKYLNKILCMS